MKKTLLWSALFTLICSQIQAETAPQPQTPSNSNLPAVTKDSPPSQNTPAQPAMQITQPAQQVTPEPVINCDYAIPASTKVIDQSLILTWSEKATVQAFDFDPTTLDAQFLKLQKCFTDQGWSGFNNALQESGNLDAIKTQKLSVSSQIDGKATITDAKDNQWKVTLPLQVVYQNEHEKVTQLLTINLTVTRKIKGDLGITQIVATPRTPVTTEQTTTPVAPGTTSATTTPTDSTPAPTTGTTNSTSTTPTTTTPTTDVNPTTTNQPIDKPVSTTTTPSTMPPTP